MSKLLPSPLYNPEFEHDACGVGFIARITGERSHDVLARALAALKALAHRGAIDADAITGDGAGVLTQLPYEIFRDHLEQQKKTVPADKDLGVGMIFLPRGNDLAQAHARKIIIEAVKEEGLAFIGWREVPVDISILGRKAAETVPMIVQALVARLDDISDDEFERKLYLTHMVSERRCTEARIDGFYVCSFSSRTIVYKGLLNAPQVRRFFPDLRLPTYRTVFALFHQRYSTNTFPTWHLAQPFRMMAHNGEINTIRGNRVRMHARERSMVGGVWGARFADLHPIVQPGMSDSASFDNVLQVLTLGGRSPLHAMTMMVPMAWEKDKRLTTEARNFYRYHSHLLEPWDGPAALVFSDGKFVGASLDRNGLRPARFKVYDDGYIVLASEAGVVGDLPGKVIQSGRLGPGRMIAVDLENKKLLFDEEVKASLTSDPRYGEWCDKHLVNLHKFAEVHAKTAATTTAPFPTTAPFTSAASVAPLEQQLAFGYDLDELELIFTPLAEGQEPVGSMGDDTPFAVLSRRPRLLYQYFKQLFAQVTNPPIDSIREKSVMSLASGIGGRLNLFVKEPDQDGLIDLDSPILFDYEVAALSEVKFLRGRVVRFPALFDPATGADALEVALKDLANKALSVVESHGARMIILSDRGVDRTHVPIPMLLAIGAIQAKLIKAGVRLRCDLIAETGEARDVHHIACLLGNGAAAVNPYLALATVRDLAANGKTSTPLTPEKAEQNYKSVIEAGLLKIMAKMGISTLLSYRGAQVFEAIGIGNKVIEECFRGTPSPIGGIGYKQIADEAIARHERGFSKLDSADPDAVGQQTAPTMHNEGFYRVNKRGEGEFHGWNPKVVAGMHKFVRNPDAENFKVFAQVADEHQPVTLKDLLKIKFPEKSVALEQVEPIEDIRKRFTTAGMSLGALSPEAHEALAIAMNRIGGKSNSGEGGEDPARFIVRPNGDNANSAIKQIASGRFGVTAEYLSSAREIEIKMAQGAKPGEGGQLPGAKVTPLIARLRYSVPGITLISPPPHHDIYSIEDLAQLIFDLKEVNPRAKVCVKLVSSSGVGTVAAGVAKAYADVILVSGHEGGTGASPLGSIKNAGSDWVLGVAEAHQVLMMNGLRNRVTLRTDGGMKTGRDIVIAALLGAEEYNFGTSALIAAGCAMFRVCHNNTCPVGVATQREDLRAKFRGKPDNVINYFNAVAEEVRRYLAKLGVRTLNEIVGRVDLLEQIDDPSNPKTRLINLSGVLHDPDPSGNTDRYHTRERNERFGNEGTLDEAIVIEARDVLIGQSAKLTGRYKVVNANRDVGTHLSGQIAYLRGANAVPPGSIDLTFTGSSGQSFGAFLVGGVRLKLVGEGNDYVGKGMAGGEIIVRPKPEETYEWRTNCVIGNTCLYGATGGSLFAAGWAGERFAVRNSGATAVVEGVGDHGCEYMTRGVVVVLGRTGLNFGAGMSGGLAFIYDERETFQERFNPALIATERLTDADEIESLRKLVALHAELTTSPHAKNLVENWATEVGKFWKVIPHAPSADWPKPMYRFETFEERAAIKV
ncbi:glutamate synthase large subunit [Oleiharenicola lentus]|uniref:glutamate synthase large subunit n=1 Tax=Oleiharenicola lentus TaxID=2508720 RepID=UPI003F67AE00